MTTTKIPPPRRLTESEDIDSFDDWWFQVECYYSRDENFRDFFNTPGFSWQSKSVQNRGLASEQKAGNLNSLLRAIATYTVGPYIKTNITDKATSLAEVKEEFLKFLQIEVNDLTAMSWFEIQRKQTERPLVFYHRLRYHMTKHLVRKNVRIDGIALPSDEKLSPSLERLIVMEWLHRMDTRLIKFVQEKFSTELSAGSNVLTTMIETLSKNIAQSSMPQEPLVLSPLTTRHSKTAHSRKKPLLPIRVPILPLVHVEVSVEELLSAAEASSPGEGSSQGEEVLAVVTKVPALAVNIATSSLSPGMLTTTIP